MIHPISLEMFTFCTQVKSGPHASVHEHTPNRLNDKKICQLVDTFQSCAHVPNDVILHVFSLHHWEVGNQSMDILEISALASIFPRVASCSACSIFTFAGLQDHFLSVVKAPGFSKLFRLGSRRSNLSVSPFLAKDVVALGFHMLCRLGNLRCDRLRLWCIVSFQWTTASYWLRFHRYMLIVHVSHACRHVLVVTSWNQRRT